MSLRKDLEEQLESYTNIEIDSSDEEYKVLELKLKALILDAVHFIDVVDQLIETNVRNCNEWIWQKQLRFYVNKKGTFYALSYMVIIDDSRIVINFFLSS